MSIWVIGGVCFCVLKAAQHIARDRKLEWFRQSHIWLHIYNVQIHQSKILKHFIRVKLCSYKGCNPTDLRWAEWNQCQVLAKSSHNSVFQGGHMSHFHLGRPGFVSGFSHIQLSDFTHLPLSYALDLQPPWMGRSCPGWSRPMRAKEVARQVPRSLSVRWGEGTSSYLYGLVAYSILPVRHPFDRVLPSWCKGCQRLLKVSTEEYGQS